MVGNHFDDNADVYFWVVCLVLVCRGDLYIICAIVFFRRGFILIKSFRAHKVVTLVAFI